MKTKQNKTKQNKLAGQLFSILKTDQTKKVKRKEGNEEMASGSNYLINNNK